MLSVADHASFRLLTSPLTYYYYCVGLKLSFMVDSNVKTMISITATFDIPAVISSKCSTYTKLTYNSVHVRELD